MKDVIIKLDELIDLLQKKIAEASETSKDLQIQLSLSKEQIKKNNIKAEELEAREKGIALVEGVVKLSEQTKKDLLIVNELRSENLRISSENSATKKNLEDKEKELKDLVALYRAKNASLEAEKVQLEKDRKDMRAKVLEDLKKLK